MSYEIGGDDIWAFVGPWPVFLHEITAGTQSPKERSIWIIRI